MVTSWLCMRHSSGHRTQRPAGILPNRTGFSITAGSLPFQNGRSPLNHALAARLDVIKSRALAAAVRWPHHQVSAIDGKADHHGLQEWSTGSNRLSLPVQAPLSPATLAANLLPVTHVVSLAQHLLTADAATSFQGVTGLIPSIHLPHPHFSRSSCFRQLWQSITLQGQRDKKYAIMCSPLSPSWDNTVPIPTLLPSVSMMNSWPASMYASTRAFVSTSRKCLKVASHASFQTNEWPFSVSWCSGLPMLEKFWTKHW